MSLFDRDEWCFLQGWRGVGIIREKLCVHHTSRTVLVPTYESRVQQIPYEYGTVPLPLGSGFTRTVQVRYEYYE